MLTQRVLSVVALGAVTIALGACGDDDSSTSDTTASSAASSGNAELIAKAEAEVEKAKEVAEFPGPTEAFYPGTGRVAVITCAQAGTNCLRLQGRAGRGEGDGLGASPIFDGEFSPANPGRLRESGRPGELRRHHPRLDRCQLDQGSGRAAARPDDPGRVRDVRDPDFDDKVFDPPTAGSPKERPSAWSAANSEEARSSPSSTTSVPVSVADRRTDAFDKITENCPDCERRGERLPDHGSPKAGPAVFTAELTRIPGDARICVMAPYDPAADPFLKARSSRAVTTSRERSPTPRRTTRADQDSARGRAVSTSASLPVRPWGRDGSGRPR